MFKRSLLVELPEQIQRKLVRIGGCDFPPVPIREVEYLALQSAQCTFSLSRESSCHVVDVSEL